MENNAVNLERLVQEKYLQRVPQCPKGNADYTVTVSGEEVKVTCSHHGEAKEF
ncbi:MAG TPA: hypothetical protein VIK75_06690 [Calditerricola sp.]